MWKLISDSLIREIRVAVGIKPISNFVDRFKFLRESIIPGGTHRRRSWSRPRRSKSRSFIDQTTSLANFHIDFKRVESSRRKVHEVLTLSSAKGHRSQA